MTGKDIVKKKTVTAFITEKIFSSTLMTKETLKHKQMNSSCLVSQYFRFASHFGDGKGLPLALNSIPKKLFIHFKLHLITQCLKIEISGTISLQINWRL